MHADVVIVGAGPVGLAFARALSGCGLSIVLIERQSARTLAAPPDDGREIALTHRSIRSLRALDAWRRLPAAHVSPLHSARVLNEGSLDGLLFEAQRRSHDLGALAPNHAIRRALFESVAARDDIHILDQTTLAAVERDSAQIVAVLDDGRRIAARLLVAADSRQSPTRAMLGIGCDRHDLQRSMLVCRVRHTLDHERVATEWFDRRQTIAMLPLNGGRSSAVLTSASAEIEGLADMSPELLGATITRRYGGRLGAMTVEGEAHVYPLSTTYADRFVTARAALIGDAAVGMHPVTAHGFNLGLQGSETLAKLVCAAARARGDIAAPALLERFQRAHRLATRPLYTATNVLAGLYADQRPPARLARHLLVAVGRRLPLVQRGVSALLLQA